MDLGKRYPVDAGKAADGVEVLIGDATFTITYYNSSIAQIHFLALVEKYTLLTTKEEAAIRAMRETLVDMIVLGWSNLKEDDVDIPYSPDTLTRMLEEYVGMDAEIMARSVTVDNFRTAAIERTKEKS